MARKPHKLRIMEASDYDASLTNGTQLIAMSVSHVCKAKPYACEILIMQLRIALLRCNRGTEHSSRCYTMSSRINKSENKSERSMGKLNSIGETIMYLMFEQWTEGWRLYKSISTAAVGEYKQRSC